MKAIKFFSALTLLFGIVLSACAPAANSPAIHVGGGKVQPDVTFTGAIESMNGNRWIVSGQTVTVDQSALRDGPFSVGDTVKVEASVGADGSVTAQRVETPSVANAVEMSTSAPEDSVSTPDALSTAAPTQAPTFDDKANEAVGTVDAVTASTITIGGQTYNFAPGAEIKGTITAGVSVKLHFTTNADGTLSVTEVAIADPTKIEDNHSNTDNPSNVSDDHGGASNGSDDGSNHDANDDNSGGSNSGGDNSGGNSGSGG